MSSAGLLHVHFEGVERCGAGRPGVHRALREPVPAEPRVIAVDPFVTWLFACFGLDAGAYDPRSLERRLAACLRALGVETPEQARARIEADPARRPSALRAMLVGVSGFFRDAAAFRALGEVLPRLAPGRPGMRVCSLGASEGQELYSVAMLLADAGRLEGSQLLGIDARPDAVTFATEGIYAPEQLSEVPAALRARHFTPVDGGAQVRAAIRARTRWQVGNVLSPPDDAPWDLVLFRNVGIYLTPDAGRRAWEGVAQRLAPDGVVMTGTAERPPPATGLRAIAPCCYAVVA